MRFRRQTLLDRTYVETKEDDLGRERMYSRDTGSNDVIRRIDYGEIRPRSCFTDVGSERTVCLVSEDIANIRWIQLSLKSNNETAYEPG